VTAPVRSCVGCGERAPQAELVRVVWRDGRLAADPRRRAGGRGAYLHRDATCAAAFVGRRGPVRSLRATVSRVAREAFVRTLDSSIRQGGD
jgi:predicted RNA-binding protein YlxR (DUF448 family)